MLIYEVANPSFPEIPLDTQIELGICEWVCISARGEYFGETKAKAIANCKRSEGRPTGVEE